MRFSSLVTNVSGTSATRLIQKLCTVEITNHLPVSQKELQKMATMGKFVFYAVVDSAP